jgi:SAM-dependent methyltransferase
MKSPSSIDRFSSRVENYVRFRPGYPEEVLAVLAGEAGLTPTSIVADIGSGTGIFAEMLLRFGATVIGVEPNYHMRQAAERLLAGYPEFYSVDAPAQATRVATGCCDIVVAAQAFHWFDTPETRAEFTRILRPGGYVALIWNVRKLDSTPFLREYEKLLLDYGTDYAEVRHEIIGKQALNRFFAAGHHSYSFPNRQTFSFESLKGRLLSSSYTPTLGHPMHEPMLGELRRIFDRHQTNGTVDFEYATEIYVGH